MAVAIAGCLASAKLTVDRAGKVSLKDISQKVVLIVSDLLAPSPQNLGEVLTCPQSIVKVPAGKMGGVDGLPSEFAVSTGNTKDSPVA